MRDHRLSRQQSREGTQEEQEFHPHYSVSTYNKGMTRRDLLALAAAAPVLAQTSKLAAPPVSVRKCETYGEDFLEIFSKMFDELGGAAKLVRGKTVTIKLNLTGSPGLRFQGKALGSTHYTHPKHVLAMATVLDSTLR